MSFLGQLLLPPRFDDYDYCPDDEFLDTAFALDELTFGAHGLVSSLKHRGRLPLNEISPWLDYKSVPQYDKLGAPVMIDDFAIMVHWDASNPTLLRPWPAKPILVNGRAAGIAKNGAHISAVPGPLANLGLPLTGTMAAVATGRANHPGLGDPLVDAAVAARTIGRGKSGKSTTGAGGRYLGIEVASSGDPKRPFTKDQIDQLEQFFSDCTRFLGRKPVVIDHARRSSDRKIDVIAYRSAVPSLRYLA